MGDRISAKIKDCSMQNDIIKNVSCYDVINRDTGALVGTYEDKKIKEIGFKKDNYLFFKII